MLFLKDLKPCPLCKNTYENLKVEDSGYSSFNVGTITCSCGFKLVLSPCSCNPIQEQIIHWNSIIEEIKNIKKLSKSQLRQITGLLLMVKQKTYFEIKDMILNIENENNKKK